MFFDREYVLTEPSEQAVKVVDSMGSLPIVVDPLEHPSVLRAVNDLQQDIEKVTEQKPSIVNDLPDQSAIIVATVKNTIVQALDIDSNEIEGKRESFLIQTIQDVETGEEQIVILGSDARGAIFGIYDFVEKLGVSPWYWWMDVPIEKHSEIYIKKGRYIEGEPAVALRGFCLSNQEESLQKWIHTHFSDFTSDFYEKLYELILRLKGNAYNPFPIDPNFNESDLMNHEKAKEFGVLIKEEISGKSLPFSLTKIWNQIEKAQRGQAASQIALANVKKIKLFEFQTEFFLRMTWSKEDYASKNLSNYILSWSEYTFGKTYGERIARIIQEYQEYNERIEEQKEEICNWTYPFETERTLTAYEKTIQLSEVLMEELPDQYKDAFYQVAYYPARLAYLQLKAELMKSLSKKLAEKQLPAANIAATEADWLIQEEKALRLNYNQRISFGKWNGVVKRVEQNTKTDNVNVSYVAESSFEEGKWYTEAINGTIADVNQRNSIVVDIYNKGTSPISLLVASSNEWLRIPRKLVDLKVQGRIKVLVDWKNAPKGNEVKGSITLQDDKGNTETIPLTIHNPEEPSANEERKTKKLPQPDFKEDYTVLPGEISYIKKAALVYVRKPGWYQFISDETFVELETIDGLNAMAVENEGKRSYYLSAGTHILHVVEEAVDIQAHLLKESHVDIRPTFRVQETHTEKNEWVVQVGIHNRDSIAQDYSLIGEINHLPFVVADRFGTKGVLETDGQELHTFTFLNEEILDAVVLNVKVNVEGWERTELFEFSFTEEIG